MKQHEPIALEEALIQVRRIARTVRILRDKLGVRPDRGDVRDELTTAKRHLIIASAYLSHEASHSDG